MAASLIPLAVRLPNWVGDVLMTLPSLALLHSHGLQLHALGKGWASDLLAGMPISVGKLPKSLGLTAKAWRATGCHEGLLFPNSFESALKMRLGGIRAVGYRKECRSILLGQGISRVDNIHEVDSYWRLGISKGRRQRALFGVVSISCRHNCWSLKTVAFFPIIMSWHVGTGRNGCCMP